MPFTRRDTWTFVCHYLLGLKRRITSQSAEHFIEKYRTEGMVLHPVKLASGNMLTCQLCGYAIAEFAVADGWLFQACSAHSLSKVLKDKSFKGWTAQIAPALGKKDASPLMQIKT
jgi:hypothetical protein